MKTIRQKYFQENFSFDKKPRSYSWSILFNNESIFVTSATSSEAADLAKSLGVDVDAPLWKFWKHFDLIVSKF